MPTFIRVAMVILALVLIVFSLSMLRTDTAEVIEPEPIVISTKTPAPTPTMDPFWDSDIHWMAMALEKESGINWPDWAVIMIGDVIMHRVKSAAYPNNVKDVLLDPDQYEPFFPPFEPFMPERRYIKLAERVMDGESYLTDPDILYQALFPQEHHAIVSYYDEILGTTTYFCK